MAAEAALTRQSSSSAVPWEVLEQRLQGLLLCEPFELERSVGFVRLVRTLVVAPLTLLGLLAPIAAFLAGHVVMGVLASVTAILIVHSLRQDTQLNTAMEQLRRGELESAEIGLSRAVAMHDRHTPQYQRACAYLAAIGWARGDHAMALQWTQARHAALMAKRGAPLDEAFVSWVTQAQLLALLGRGAEARAALEKLPEQPPGDDPRFIRALVAAKLLVAHTEQRTDDVEDSLDRWEVGRDTQSDPLIRGLIAWARERLGQRDRAMVLVERLRTEAPTVLIRHMPGLWHWVETYDPTSRRL